jgi:hypothetical protein
VRVSGVTTPVAELLALPISAPMDGSWTLALQLGQDSRSLTGTAVLTLSNGVHYAYSVRGRRSGAVAVLSLVGDPADPAAGALSLRATVLPQAGNWGTLQDFSGTGYGQALTW